MSLSLAGLSPEESGQEASRRDRAAIAAQACQTCRSRKSKCDEKRPKCGLCTRLAVDCVYREPQPTKKDKTLVHILSVLERVESKVDRLSAANSSASSQPTPAFRDEPSMSGPSSTWEQVEVKTRQRDRASTETYLPPDLISATSHLTAAHKVLVWPAVFLLLTNARLPITNDLHHIVQLGTPWFTHVELQKHPAPLPVSSGSSTTPINTADAFTIGMFGLGPEDTHRLTDAYFSTFNILHPILDRGAFLLDVITPAIRGTPVRRDGHACVAMLVLALGMVALQGVSGQPLFGHHHANTSGIRGGSAEEPPGLDIFNQARARFGFIMHECTLENVQIHLLQATYYEASARHMEFWRACVAASMSFQVYIRCERVDWSSAKADLIKRVYWTCILNEDLYHLELDLPKTGIYALEHQVPLPSFQHSRLVNAQDNEESSHYHYHFLAMIALRRLIARIHASLYSDPQAKAEAEDDGHQTPVPLINELARQLESWRTFLPQALQWTDADALSLPNLNPLARRQPPPLFTVDDDSDPAIHRYNLDIITGHLRTRFYYARYMIYRPFIFRALHFPGLMTDDDASYCALAMQSACMWPLSMSPCKNKKRLVPHLFTWTQNFIGILLLIRMTTESQCLQKICEERVNAADMEATVVLLLDWLADMRPVDGVADWSWRMLEPLFRDWRR